MLLSQLGIKNGDGAIRSNAMSVRIRRIVRHSAEREGVFVQILGIAQQNYHEIAAADVMRQVAEEHAAVRVVTHVLNDGAPVSVTVGFAQLFAQYLRKTPMTRP